MRPFTITGQRVVLTINDVEIAAGFVLDYTISTQYDENEAIDSVLPFELTPNRIKVRLNVRVYRLPSNDPSYQDFFAAGSPQTAQTDKLEDFTLQKPITLEVRDKVSDMTVLFLPQAQIVQRSGSVNAEDILTENWSIVGIGFQGPTNKGILGGFSL